MYFRQSSWTAGALVAALACGCASQKSSTEQGTEGGYSQAKAQELESERLQYIQEREKKLREMDTNISRLEARIENEGKFVDAEQKAEWSQDLFDARQEQAKVRGEVERARAATPEEWAEMRSTTGSWEDSVQAAFGSGESEEPAPGAPVSLCMMQVEGASAIVTERGDQLVVRMTTSDESQLGELRSRAERMSRQASAGYRSMAPGERPTGDTSKTSEEQRASMVENVMVENIADGVSVTFDPAEGQETALRQQLQRDAERVRNQQCG